MRSGTGTKSGEPSPVTFSTKVTIAFFAAVLFHEGSGSAAKATLVNSSRTNKNLVIERFIVVPSTRND